MPELTLPQRIAIAGGIARVLANHGSDVASLVGDAKSAMRIAAEIHGVIDGVTVQASPKPAAAAAPIVPAEKPYDVPPAQKLSANRAAYHVAQNGLTPGEQAIFDRASQSSG